MLLRFFFFWGKCKKNENANKVLAKNKVVVFIELPVDSEELLDQSQ